jgi:hypothetical protein
MIKDLRTRPSESDHGSNLAEAQAAWDANKDSYVTKRKAAYPSNEEQFDLQYWDKKNGTNKWVEAIDKVKSDNPKP